MWGPYNLHIVGAIVVHILLIEWDGTSLKQTLLSLPTPYRALQWLLGPSRNLSSPRDHPHTFQSAAIYALRTRLEGFPVPGCVAAGNPQRLLPDRLAGIIQMELPVCTPLSPP